jgi:hypothetical protein
LTWNLAASGGFTRSRSIRSRIRRISATRSTVIPSGGYAKSAAFSSNRRPSVSSPAIARARSSAWNSHVCA